MKRFYLVSLGCAKNTVDSESMSQVLFNAGYQIVNGPTQADVLIVNTCGFIAPAREESLTVLKELANHKRKGQLLIAAGCLTQRYGVEVARRVPGIDGVLGTRRWNEIVDLIQRLRSNGRPGPLYHIPEGDKVVIDLPGVKRVAVQGSSAYLKIADGCRRPCAFCAIPLIKGTAVSRPLEAIIREALALQDSGVRELILIAQDTTDYGHDLGMKDGLSILLEKLATALEDSSSLAADPQRRISWIRIMYAFPGYVTDRMIETMAKYPQILPYLDIPLQHASREVLRRMRRPANIEWVYRTIEKLRLTLPGITIRTTFIVGYPGETEAAFQELLDFISEVRFDRVGAFKFSFELGTPSEPLGDPIPEEVKTERWERLMALQQGISLQKNQSLVGSTLEVLIEGNGEGLSIGRTYRDAPEIDGLIFVEGNLPSGEIVPVRVTGALAYDLTGVAVAAHGLIEPAGVKTGIARQADVE